MAASETKTHAAAPELPTGVVTFLFTDIEGSTRLVERLGPRYAAVLADHRRILRAVWDEHEGHEVHAEADSGLVVFAEPSRAVAAAIAAQCRLAEHTWPDGGRVRVRIGINTGEAALIPGDYVGMAVHLAARVADAGHGGQILLAPGTYAVVGSVLPDAASGLDLGEYRLKDITERQRIHQVCHPALPAEFAPLRTLKVLPNNLPEDLTSFVGRHADLATVCEILRTSRLVTLTGPGGVGKTRLALQAARSLVVDHPDGVWLVDLTSIRDPALVPHSSAAVLGLRTRTAGSVTADLTDFLETREVLLVLDNCEHLLAAAADLVTGLLRRCPMLRVLTTSREPLGVPGEVAWPVRPLELSDGSGSADAVRLFRERAGSAGQGNDETILRICRVLDGIPLAIELAAALCAVLDPEQIAERLHDRFRLLSSSGAASGPRGTLRATVDWSHDLLEPGERLLFRRLAVFRNGFTIEAAEAVCGSTPLERSDVFDLLVRLVRKSLVERRDGRFGMLETIRAYARERLDEAGETTRFRELHLEHNLGLVSEAAPHLEGPDQRRWLEVLDAETDNLRAALRWALRHRTDDTAVRLAAPLGRLWSVRGDLEEGRLWLSGALEAAPPTVSAPRAEALRAAALLSRLQGDYGSAQALYEESLSLLRELGNESGIADRLTDLGSLAWQRGDYETAAALLTEGLEGHRARDEHAGTARALHNLANLYAVRGEPERGRALYEEALSIRREIGDLQGIAETLNNLGILRRLAGDLSAARSMTEEALSIVRDLRNLPLTAAFEGNLGIIAHRQGDYPAARALHEESLALRRQMGDREGVAISLNSLGTIAFFAGDAPSAAAWFEESLAVRRQLGDRRGIGESLNNLAAALRYTGDLDRAEPLADESLAIRRELGDRQGEGRAVYNQAYLRLSRGRIREAMDDFAWALRVASELGDRSQVISTIEGIATACLPERTAKAVELWWAADRARRDLDLPHTPLDEGEFVSALSHARGILTAEAYEEAAGKGRDLDLDAAVEAALSLVAPGPQT